MFMSNTSNEREQCKGWPSTISWCNLLDNLKNNNDPTKINELLGAVYEISMDYLQVQTEKQTLRSQLESYQQCDCARLQKILESKNAILEALGSLIVKLEETRNVDTYLPEAYRILTSESTILTPSDSNKKDKLTPTDKPEKVLKCKESPTEHKSFEKTAKISKTPVKERVVTLKLSKNKPLQIKIKKEDREKITLEERFEAKVLSMDKSSEVSVTDESVCEIQGTPGRTSPVIGLSKMKKNGNPIVKSVELRSSPKTNATLCSPKRNSLKTKSKLKQTVLSVTKATHTVNLSSLVSQDGGMRTSSDRLEVLRGSTQDDDIIQPSPTSEGLAPLRRRLEADARPDETWCPLAPVPAATPDLVYEEPMETDDNSLEGSIDLLQRHRSDPVSPSIINIGPSDVNVSPSAILRENRQSQDSPVKCERDLSCSVSVLRPRGRENISPGERKPKTPIKRSPPTDAVTTQCADDSVSLLRPALIKPAVIPSRVKPEPPSFPYKEETVRKKADKRLLKGWSCDKCDQFYAHVQEPARLARLTGLCSRHRGRRDPRRARSPPGYWDNHLSVPGDTEELNRINNAH